MLTKTPSPESLQLLMDGVLALAEMESVGVTIDVERLQKTKKKLEKRVARHEKKLKSHETYKYWRWMKGKAANLGSRPQLAEILIRTNTLKQEECYDEETQAFSTSIDVLSNVKDTFVQEYIKYDRVKRTLSTFIGGIERELVGNKMHPVQNLHTVVSYRGSADSPNSTNFPRRNEEASKIVRSCIIPKNENYYFLDVDFKAAEVCISACYNEDPVLISYIEDKTKDMHRDMAAECFMVPIKSVSKPMRDIAKNQFVFPQFYGSSYQNCTKDMWESLTRYDLKTEEGKSLVSHLLRKGISTRGNCVYGKNNGPIDGSLEQHIKRVQKNFWGKRFKVYADWKEQWWRDYLRRGYIEYLNGFIVHGEYKKNEIINYPIQGFSFHCLLWCLIKFTKYVIKHKLRSRAIMQIHDSLLIQVHKKELDDVIEIIQKLVNKRIRKHWPCIIVPLTVEASLGKHNWYDKEEIEI